MNYLKILKSSVVILSFFLFCSACKVTESNDDSKPFYISSFVSKWDGSTNDYEFSFNEEKDLVLCVRFDLKDSTTFDYSIYDKVSEEEIYSSGFIGSDISWLNNEEVLIEGTSRLAANESIIINVRTKESRVQSENILKKNKK